MVSVFISRKQHLYLKLVEVIRFFLLSSFVAVWFFFIRSEI